ncbi:MAG: O-antigen ligase family protein [Clostridiaceae bacterium]|nr:O-antigen ligase family protein [Clostridiaceae bacterium]
MFNTIKKYFNSKETSKPDLLYVPFFIVAFVIPVIMFPVSTSYNTEMRDFLLSHGLHTDYYHLIKVIVLYLSALLLLVLLIFNNRKKLPLMFVILVPVYFSYFISTYLSHYKISALFGIFDHYEGFITQTCYLLILICSFAICTDIKFIYNIIKIILWAGVFAAVIGIFQYTGGWPFATQEPYSITSTIGNSNYVGTFSAMLFPLSASMLLTDEKLKSKIIYLFLFFGSSFFLLLGSMSRAAFIAFIAIVPLFLILLRKEIRKNYIWVLSAFMYCIALFFAMNVYSENMLVNELKSMNPFNSETQQKLVFSDIAINENVATISTNKWHMDIEVNDNGYIFKDGTGENIPIEFDEQKAIINIGQPYHIQAYVQQKQELKWMLLKIDGKDIEFIYIDDSLKVVGFNGMLTDVNTVEFVRLPFGDSFASGRGYIWSRTIPLLKKAVFIGYGPDTFPYFFPQNDIIGKLNYGAIWTVISKPHNWYFQIAFGSGVISMICLLIFFMWYGINVIKENRFHDNKTRILSYGILLSVVGYLITGIFNDSVVSVSPIFWMLLGFGISVNSHLAITSE